MGITTVSSMSRSVDTPNIFYPTRLKSRFPTAMDSQHSPLRRRALVMTILKIQLDSTSCKRTGRSHLNLKAMPTMISKLVHHLAKQDVSSVLYFAHRFCARK